MSPQPVNPATPFAPSDRAVRGAIGYKSARQFGPMDRPARPEEIKPDEPTVTMVFPRRVLLTLPGYKRVDFPAGVHEVPQSLVDHPYLKDNGAKRQEKPKAAKVEPPGADDDPSKVDLSKLTKQEILDHAEEHHPDLDLNLADHKDKLIAQVEEARKAKE